MAQPLTSVDPLLPLLREKPFGLLSDIDGTLAPIVPRPEDARVPEESRELLAALMARGVRVALATGRPLAAALTMVGLDEPAYATEHGLSLWLDGRLEVAPGAEEYEPLAAAAERDLAPLAESVPGLQLENKGSLLAVHYRRAEDAGAARQAALAAIGRSAAAARFRLHEGRMVLELRPPLDLSKGTAAEALIERLELAAAVCLGDDVTDIDMFEAVRRRGARGLHAVTIAATSEEAAPALLETADYTVEGTEGVRLLLAELLRALPE